MKKDNNEKRLRPGELKGTVIDVEAKEQPISDKFNFYDNYLWLFLAMFFPCTSLYLAYRFKGVNEKSVKGIFIGVLIHFFLAILTVSILIAVK